MHQKVSNPCAMPASTNCDRQRQLYCLQLEAHAYHNNLFPSDFFPATSGILAGKEKGP